jgi:pyruvate,water dikinase
MSCLIRSGNVNPTDQLGGKARALATLGGAGLPVPPWLVVTPKAFEGSLTSAQRRAIASARDHREAGAVLGDARLAPAVEAELVRALSAIVPNGGRLAVRSSAVDEDSADHSFAGQLQSFLFVARDDLPRRIADVWRSGFGERVFAYRRQHNLPLLPDAPAVLIQPMVDADVSGVAFSVDPVTGDRATAVVASLYGLGTALVSGESDADTHYVGLDGRIVDRKLARKRRAHRFSEKTDEGVEACDIDDERTSAPALQDDQIVAIANLARKAERFFGRPQDIEWAIESGTLYLLQSRPITSLANIADPNGVLRIWDNSNITESYSGITTPLTFSFARHAYEGVYRGLCKIFRVPERRIEAHNDALANMVGIIRGRVYYNLLNWHRLLTTLPGARSNQAFLEQMIGVKKRLPQQALEPAERVPWHSRLVDAVCLIRTAGSIVANYWLLGWKRRRFYRRVETVLGAGRRDISSLGPDQLVADYRRLESRLLTHWDAPLINDFYAMIFYGGLRKLCIRWCGDKAGTLQNDLLCHAGGMVSTEPAERIEEMAAIASNNPELVDALCEADTDDILAMVARHDALRSRLDAYLEKFGDRCTNELKLESPTLHEEPLMLLRSIGGLARRPVSNHTTHDSGASGGAALRRRAEKRVRAVLGANPFRRVVFSWVLGNTRGYIRGRENLRLERTRVFGRVRQIFVELGKRFHVLGLLERPHDIFHLEIDEVNAFVEGTSTCTNLRKLAALRKEEFATYPELETPANRFETRGIVYQGNAFRADAADGGAGGDARAGIGCCPGRVSGRVRVVLDPRGTTLRHGDILVAEHTDPSWIMLFPFAAGLLVERGSLLSHSAIVAREMGIPAIVAIDGVTRWLDDGDRVELDGATGVVKKIDGA